eukprot:12938694-Prorocentrum_lima.AAC.1
MALLVSFQDTLFGWGHPGEAPGSAILWQAPHLQQALSAKQPQSQWSTTCQHRLLTRWTAAVSDQ